MINQVTKKLQKFFKLNMVSVALPIFEKDWISKGMFIAEHEQDFKEKKYNAVMYKVIKLYTITFREGSLDE